MPHEKNQGRRVQTNNRKVERIVSLCILLLAVIWRTGFGLRMPITYLYGDMVHYDHITNAMLGYHVYAYWSLVPDAQITPGYPLFLSLCYLIANLFYPNHLFELLITTIVQSILSGITVYLVYQISRLCMGRKLSAFAAIAYFLYPPAAWAPTLLLTETLYTCLLLLSFYLFVIASERKNLKWWAICGLTFGICCLVRPSVFPFITGPLVFAVYKLFKHKLRINKGITKLQFRHALAYSIGFIIPLLPWWIRNLVTLHSFLLTDTDAGNPLLYGSDPNFQTAILGLGLDASDQTKLALLRIGYGFTHEFWSYLWWYTGEKLLLLFEGPWYLHVGSYHYSGWGAFVLFRLHLHIWFVIAGTLGLFIGLLHAKMRFVSIFAFILILLLLPFIPINRYAFPVMPFFFIGTSFFVGWLLAEFRRFGSRSTAKAKDVIS